MFRDIVGWFKKLSPVKQIAILFLFNCTFWFFALWLGDKFLTDEEHSFVYYIPETLIMSVIITVSGGWSTIKSTKTKTKINSSN